MPLNATTLAKEIRHITREIINARTLVLITKSGTTQTRVRAKVVSHSSTAC